MNDFIFRKAELKDIDAVEKVYEAVLDKEESTGIIYTNWRKNLYPTRKDAEKAFSLDTLFVAETEGEIAGAVILNHIQPPEYSNINWTYEAEGEEVLVIHTLCIHPDFRGRKCAERFVAFSEEWAKKLGCKAVRLDTYEGNEPAIKLYTKLGYNYTGSTHFNFQNVIPEILKCFDKLM